jgi:predicted aspartyl protease
MCFQPSSSIRVKVTGLITACLFLYTSVSFPGTSVRFNLVAGHWIVVPVTINGSGPFHLVLDTGSALTFIDPSLITRLGGKEARRYQLLTATGSIAVPCYRIENFKLGSQYVEYLDVLARGGPEIQGMQINGILGQDFLTKFNFILDYQSQTITFEENEEYARSLSGEVYALLDSAQRKLVLIPPQSHESRPSLFSLDSGAKGIVLFGSDFKGLGFDMNSVSDPEPLQTVVGRGFVSRGTFRSFKIGDNTLRNLRVQLAPDSKFSRYRIENGLLPTNFFQTIYFNNVQKFVSFNPRFENATRVKE